MMHPFLFAIAHQLEETNIDGVCSNGVSLLFTSSFKKTFFIYINTSLHLSPCEVNKLIQPYYL